MSIKLHGIIARRFEKELDIPSEIDESFLFDFLNMKFDGFKLFVQRQAQEGIFYKRIKVDEDYHIVPIICGNIGQIIAASSTLMGNIVGNFGIRSAIRGVQSLMSPDEEQMAPGAESAVVLQSTRFSGLENKASQGSKVPVGYGRLKIGSKLVMQKKNPVVWSDPREIENIEGFSQLTREYFNPTTSGY